MWGTDGRRMHRLQVMQTATAGDRDPYTLQITRTTRLPSHRALLAEARGMSYSWREDEQAALRGNRGASRPPQ
jgi:hypothetical protein